MNIETRNKILNYIDLFILFIQLDLFIWILFELGYPFRPLIYRVTIGVILILLFEVIIEASFSTRLTVYLRNNWYKLFFVFIGLYFYWKFVGYPQSGKYISILSKLFLGGLELLLFIKFILQLQRIKEIIGTFRVSPAQLIIVSFATIILIGSFLLYLPYSRPRGSSMRYIDALFTSVSAVCVTGLVVVDTGAAFSAGGKVLLLMLIQAGGIGIMTIAAFIQLSLGSQMSLFGRFSTASVLGQTTLKDLYEVIKAIVKITFIIEGFGSLLLFMVFMEKWGMGIKALFYGVFHSISAFCNAGFSLFSDSFTGWVGIAKMNFLLIMLIILGGLGFTVILNLWRRLLRGRTERITVQTKIVLIMSTILIIVGGIEFFIFESDNVLKSLKPGEKFLASLFQSVTARTAGFNTVDISALRPITLFALSILMFIGASPGSTGGGIKTTTFFILILSIVTILRDRRFNTVFNRRIPFQVVNRAFAILVSALGIVVLATLLLGVFENFSFPQLYFEVVSAFGTVGLSTGITPYLTDAGKIIIMLLMFIGRLGPLTIVLAVGAQPTTRLVTYPEEQVMVG